MAEEFQCRAINDYYASVTDELDLKAGSVYTIMQTSPSGWWYAVNEDGEDGWVPSNYLEPVDDQDAGGGGGFDDNGGYDLDDGKQDQPTTSATTSAGTSATTANQSSTTQQIQQPTQQQQDQQNAHLQQQQAEQQQQAAAQNQGGGSNNQPQTYDVPSTQPSATNNTQPVVGGGGGGGSTGAAGPDKPITQWSVLETLEYLRTGLVNRNDFKLTQACRYLTQLATQDGQCVQILANNGIDVIFDVMRATNKDVAIQMSCCAAIVVLCANPASKQYPSSSNGIFAISQAVKSNTKYRPFTILAFNAVCNFCHDHPHHRNMALETDIVDAIIDGMERFLNEQEGYRVQVAGCLALRNIAADPKGQASVGPRGVHAIIQALDTYRETRDVVEAGMGVMCNLCALPANGEAFLMGNGLQTLDAMFSDTTAGENVRLASASVLHNLAANSDTAVLLSSDEGIDLLLKIIKKSPVDSLLFLNTLKVLAALLFKLPEDNKPAGNKKPEVMQRILARGLAASLNEAVGFDSKELQEVAATVFVVIAQTSPALAQALADVNVPVNLVNPCLHDPTPQMLHCSFAIFFHVSSSFENQNALVDGGLLDLVSGDWYARDTTRDDTLRIGCGVLIKFFSNFRNSQAIAQHEPGIRQFVHYCRANKPELHELIEAIDQSLNQLDPSAVSTAVVSETTSSVQQQQQAPPQQPEPEPEPEPVPQQVVQEPERVEQKVEPTTESGVLNTGGRTHFDENSPDGPIIIDRFYTYEELRDRRVRVDVQRREAYLTDEEFNEVFRMTKDDFYNLRSWKQKQLRKQKGLF